MDKINGHRLEAGSEAGFTIVETVIAIAIFSFLIIFCLGMFIFVGRIYYRGLYEGQTQEVARSIVDRVSESLRNSGKDLEAHLTVDTDGWKAYCIGGVQYSFKENVQLITEVPPGDRQSDEVFIIADACNEPSTNDPAPPPDCPVPPPVVPCANQKVELMHEKMRLLKFEVDDQGDGLFDVEIKVALGGDLSDLEFDNTVFRYTDEAAPPNDVNPAVDISPTDASIDWQSGRPRLPGSCSDTTYNHSRADCLAAGETWTGYFNNLQIAQCQSGETFCALIDFKTKAFRRVF